MSSFVQSRNSSSANRRDSASTVAASTHTTPEPAVNDNVLASAHGGKGDIDEKQLSQRLPNTGSGSDNETEINAVTEPAPEFNEIAPIEKSNTANDDAPAAPVQPYSAFSSRQKWTIVALASLAGIFGPISSNIYVPAIPQIVDQFHKSTQKIDLTLTIYL